MGKRVAIILGFILLAMLALLCLVPVIFQKQLNEHVKAEINERVNATVDYKDISISLFHNFPNLTVSLNDLTVTSQGDFNGDTVASVKRFGFTVDILSIIRGNGYKVVSLNLLEPVLKLKVNNEGYPNWNIIKTQFLISKDAVVGAKEGGDTGVSFRIDSWKVEQANVRYLNDTAHTSFIADGLNISGSQNALHGNSDYNVSTIIKELSYQAGGVSYLQNAKLDAAIGLSFEGATGKYEIKNNLITLNGLSLLLKGSVTNTIEGRNYNISIQAKDTAFKNLLSLIPVLYDSSFAQTKASGNFSFSGNITGLNNETQSPAFSFKLNVKEGMFQKPDFGQPVKNIFVDATAVKPQGLMDSSVFQISHLHIETGQNSADAKLLVTTPYSNAGIVAEIKGGIDVSTIQQFYAIDDVTQLNGALQVDLRFKGRKNDLDSKSYKLIQASGEIEAKNVVFQKKDWPVALQVKEADFSVLPNAVSLHALRATLGKSNITGTGNIDNVIPYLAQQSQLKIDLALNADIIDLRELSKKVQSEKKPSQSSTANANNSTATVKKTNPERKADWSIRIAANRVYNDKLVLANVQGTVISINDTLRFKDMSADVLGGKITGNIICNNYNAEHASAGFDMKASNIDIAQVYQNIDDAEKTAPALKYLSGAFSGNISGNGNVKMGDCFKLERLSANGNLNYPDLKINEMPVLMQIGKLAKLNSLDHLEAKNVQTAFHLSKGNSTIDPTSIKFTNGYKLNFKGTSYANQTLDADIALDVPVKEMGSIASLAQNLLSNFMSVPENVHFGFKVSGKNTDPKVTVVNVGTSGN